MPDLSQTPGVYYALGYWLSVAYYVLRHPRRQKGGRVALTLGTGFLLLAAWMTVTKDVPQLLFIPTVGVSWLMLLTMVYLSLRAGKWEAGYIAMRAFLLGEFAASLEWQLFHYGLVAMKLPLNMLTNLAFLVVVHGAIFGIFWLLESRGRRASPTDVRRKDFTQVAIITAACFALSNLSYVFTNTPFSTRSISELFIIRTYVDLCGVSILWAYDAQLHQMNTRLEKTLLENLLQAQYNNYILSQQSIDLTNQKYHDLKHQIALLRSDVTTPGEKTAYLDQMEQEIRIYEAQNKTGSPILDTILTTKSIQCQKQGIQMTVVADGAALDFMTAMDVTALFGNALDNAIEAVSKIGDPQQRLIHLSVAQQRSFLAIKVENCCTGDVVMENGLPLTTKRNRQYHGYGVKSIRSIAQKYDGSISVHVKDGWFELRVLIPLSHPGKE